MNINFYFLSSHTLSVFKENFLSALTAQQKKILVIASIAFGCLLACYCAIHYYWFKDHDIQPIEPDIDIALGDEWWLKLGGTKALKDFKANWKDLTIDPAKCKSKSKKLQAHCKLNFQNGLSGRHNTPLGTIYAVPNNFSMWMPGVAFVASYLTAKKNMEGLFVCQTLEAFSTRLTEIALSDKDQRCALIVGTMQPGLQYAFPLLNPNFPQHKVTICVEKKGGKLTIASLESMPSPGTNDTIDPDHLTDNLWEGNRRRNAFNPQELVFRAVLKACRHAQCDARLLHSIVVRQKVYGCETFALLDGLAYLRDSDFFNKIACSKDVVQIDKQYKIERMIQLPPEFMIGLQSNKLLTDYIKTIDLEQPLIQKKKTFQDYIETHQVEVAEHEDTKLQNHYIIKKSYKYLTLLIESLNNLHHSEIKQIINKTLITKVDKNLFPDFEDALFGPECAYLPANWVVGEEERAELATYSMTEEENSQEREAIELII